MTNTSLSSFRKLNWFIRKKVCLKRTFRLEVRSITSLLRTYPQVDTWSKQENQQPSRIGGHGPLPAGLTPSIVLRLYPPPPPPPRTPQRITPRSTSTGLRLWIKTLSYRHANDADAPKCQMELKLIFRKLWSLATIASPKLYFFSSLKTENNLQERALP